MCISHELCIHKTVFTNHKNSNGRLDPKDHTSPCPSFTMIQHKPWNAIPCYLLVRQIDKRLLRLLPALPFPAGSAAKLDESKPEEKKDLDAQSPSGKLDPLGGLRMKPPL